MNTELIKTLEQQLTEISGMLVLAGYMKSDDDDSVYWLKQAHARVTGLVQGLRIIEKPMTLAELEQKQFDRAQAVNEEFLNFMEHDATWGH